MTGAALLPEHLPNAVTHGVQGGSNLGRDADGENGFQGPEGRENNLQSAWNFVELGVNAPDFTWFPNATLEGRADASVNDGPRGNLGRDFRGNLDNNRHRPFRGILAAPQGTVASDHTIR